MENGLPERKHWVFVGLGNPGKKYEMTRHNMGYLVVQAFADLHKYQLKEDKQMLALNAKGGLAGKEGQLSLGIHLVLPTTYMNESGQAVRKYLDYYKLNVTDLLVICDDIELPFGQMRLREKGSAGGHNGLKSIEKHLGTQVYARLRVGIGHHSGPNQVLSDYVLDKFTAEEFELLPSVLKKGTQALQRLLTDPLSRVMNEVNVRCSPT